MSLKNAAKRFICAPRQAVTGLPLKRRFCIGRLEEFYKTRLRFVVCRTVHRYLIFNFTITTRHKNCSQAAAEPQSIVSACTGGNKRVAGKACECRYRKRQPCKAFHSRAFPKSAMTARRDAWRRPVETFQMTIILGECVPSVRISRSSVTRRNQRTDEYRTRVRDSVRATAVEDSDTVTREPGCAGGGWGVGVESDRRRSESH
jgi:hypothetical protein